MLYIISYTNLLINYLKKNHFTANSLYKLYFPHNFFTADYMSSIEILILHALMEILVLLYVTNRNFKFNNFQLAFHSKT